MKSLYLLLLFHFQFQTSKSNKIKLKASRQSGFENTFQISDAIGIYERLSIIQCLEQCDRNTRCLSFFFNENKQKCILHSTTFWDESPSSSGKGWRLYYTVDVTGRCPPDNGFIYYRELDLCFNLNDGVYMNFNSIVKPICTAVGAEMVRVDSEERNSFIMKIVEKKFVSPHTHVCIQATNQIAPNLKWTFEDGTPMTYFNWDKDYYPPQPENRANEPRIAIARSVGTWHDFTQSSGYKCLVVCERP